MKERQLTFFKMEENNLTKKMQLVMNMDMVSLIGILFFLLLIGVFCLGVEKGKKIMLAKINKENNLVKKIENLEIKDVLNSKNDIDNNIDNNIEKLSNLKEGNLKEEINIKNNQTFPTIEEKEIKENIKNKNKKYYYIIQLASYIKEEIAKKEVEILKKSGFPVFMEKKDKFLVIFVGKFDTLNEAEKNKTILQKKYKDCFIRRL